jgi:PPE-repeat protein
MEAAAVRAEQTAAQARAAAGAFETAFAATVAPPAIAANRIRLASLVAGNVLGHNAAAIAATEAQYGDMWAQDAAAMYGYAATSAVATDVAPFEAPEEIAAASTPAGPAGGTLTQLMSSVPGGLQSMASPASTVGGWNPFAPGSASDTTGLNGVLNALFGTDTAFGNFINANIWNTIFGSGFYLPGNFLGTAADYIGLSQAGSTAADGAAAGAAEGAAAGAADGVAAAAGDVVAAGVGASASVGPLSVPPTWTGGAPPGPLAGALGGTPMVAPPPAAAVGMGGVPLMGVICQGAGRNPPQYGFKPTFVARPPAAG